MTEDHATDRDTDAMLFAKFTQYGVRLLANVEVFRSTAINRHPQVAAPMFEADHWAPEELLIGSLNTCMMLISLSLAANPTIV